MKVGDRVGAFAGTTADTVYLLGYGSIKRFGVPRAGSPGVPAKLTELGKMIPLIKFDDGSTAWGCECHFAAEERIKEIIVENKMKVQAMTVDAMRREKERRASAGVLARAAL